MKKVLLLTMMASLATILLLTSCSQTTVSSAKIYMNQFEYDQAIEQCELAIEQKPDNPEAYFIMGRAYGFKKMYREMNDAFIKSLELSNKYASDIREDRQKHWTDLQNAGVTSLKQNRISDAIEEFSMAIELVPEETVPYKNLALAYIQNRNDSLATQTYEKILEIDPEDLESKGILGALYYRNRDYNNAIAHLEQVVNNADPTSSAYSQAVFNLALAYDMTEQSDKALETYKNALEVNPDEQNLLFNMGRLYIVQQDYENAIVYLKRVLEQNPDDLEANRTIGSCYNLLNKFEEAIPYLEKAVELDPNDANAWNQMGIAYIRTGQGEKGQAAFDKVLELQNNQ
ncbi:tetratricopeptide repeat protein [bacterium]|nr:tetratricopeptide repeat protein [bacterium]RQV93804.1 MAG: tetratricopeptide repeat protein [bacterium]